MFVDLVLDTLPAPPSVAVGSRRALNFPMRAWSLAGRRPITTLTVMVLHFKVLLEPEEEGFHAFIPRLPGVHTYGATRDEAIDYVKEAAEAYLEDMQAQGEPPPIEQLEETEIEVAVPA
jgi:predicted RNase H-like HicB family nuclease